MLPGGAIPPSEIIGRGRYICRGSHTDELLCEKCYITDIKDIIDIIDIIPSGWPARVSRFAGFEMRLQDAATHFSRHPQMQNDCR